MGPTAGYTVDKVSPTGVVTEYPTDFTPHGVAFDGTHIWVTNNGGNDVTKIVAATGASAGTYLVGGYPEGIAFDGTNMWIANSADNNVSRL